MQMNVQTIRTKSTPICVFMGEKREKVSPGQFINLLEFLYPDKSDVNMWWER